MTRPPGRNLALLHYTAPPVVGGVESVLAHQARLMTAAGHHVRIIAARGEAWEPAITLARVPLVDSRHPAILAAKAELDAGRQPANWEALVQELMAALPEALGNSEVLIAHNVCSLHKNLPLTAALHRLYRHSGFPRLILWHHDLAWTSSHYQAELHPGYPWDLLRADWPGAVQVVVSAERQRELAELLSLPPDRIRVIPNGVDLDAFLKLEPQTVALVRRLDLLATAPLLLLPVRITARKNIELALHILAELRALATRVPVSSLPNPALIITGPLGAHNPANAVYFEQLKALRAALGLHRSVFFLAEHTETYLPDAVIADFFHLADALLLPSREEGFGIPLLEAAFSHRPIFCADIPTLRELGQEDVTYFSPEAPPAQVARLIAARLGDNPVFRFAARARTHFTWDQVYTNCLAPLIREDSS